MDDGLYDLTHELETDDEPTLRTRAVVPKGALRPPPVPREFRAPRAEPTPSPKTFYPPQSEMMFRVQVLRELSELRVRMRSVERRLLVLGACIVVADKLDVAALLDVAKALASP